MGGYADERARDKNRASGQDDTHAKGAVRRGVRGDRGELLRHILLGIRDYAEAVASGNTELAQAYYQGMTALPRRDRPDMKPLFGVIATSSVTLLF